MDPEIPNFKSVHDLLPNEPSQESFLKNNLPTEATDFLVFLRLEEENSSRSSEISLLPDFPNFGYDFDGQSVEYLLEFLTGNASSLLAPVLGMSEREQLFISMLYGTAIAVALMGNLAVILVFSVWATLGLGSVGVPGEFGLFRHCSVALLYALYHVASGQASLALFRRPVSGGHVFAIGLRGLVCLHPGGRRG